MQRHFERNKLRKFNSEHPGALLGVFLREVKEHYTCPMHYTSCHELWLCAREVTFTTFLVICNSRVGNAWEQYFYLILFARPLDCCLELWLRCESSFLRLFKKTTTIMFTTEMQTNWYNYKSTSAR